MEPPVGDNVLGLSIHTIHKPQLIGNSRIINVMRSYAVPPQSGFSSNREVIEFGNNRATEIGEPKECKSIASDARNAKE